jgi:hypothetical protein
VKLPVRKDGSSSSFCESLEQGTGSPQGARGCCKNQYVGQCLLSVLLQGVTSTLGLWSSPFPQHSPIVGPILLSPSLSLSLSQILS